MNDDPFNLQRFVDAQQSVFKTVLAELEGGEKQSHWIWFIFPQLRGLGRSPTAQFYAIGSMEEARAYLAHPLLGPRLRKSVAAIQRWAGRLSAPQILGPIDAGKLRSSLTLFEEIEPAGLFTDALQSFCDGQPDERTLALLNAQR